jgi:hypothetical protein
MLTYGTFLSITRRYAVTTKVGSINEKYQIQEYITSVYSKISSAIVPAERVVVPPLEHIGEIINQSLQTAGKAIEQNYNATNRYAWLACIQSILYNI